MDSIPQKPRPIRNTLLAGIGSLAILVAAQPVAADMFRWVGKDGQVHYGDSLPPAQSSRGYEIINPATGEVIQKISPAKTAAQLAAEAAAKKAEEKRQAEAEEQRRQDQVLLDLYSKVGDIKRARDARIADIDRQVSQLQAAVKRANARASDTTQPKSARSDAKNDAQQMEQTIKQLHDKRAEVMLKFENIIKRFKAIKDTRADN